MSSAPVCAIEEKMSSSQRSSADEAAARSYQETERFCTWRKHCRDLYQQLFHIDLVWESPAAQLMPYTTTKDNVTTHTILCGTRTGGQEQSYLQMLSAAVPSNTNSLDASDAAYSEATGEVGGYGAASHQAGLKVERRILHCGDVLAARYMPANPLLAASASSDANLYVVDWSRVSLNKFPNDPPRPRAPLPPNELSSNPSDEERASYQKRMRALSAVVNEQDRWDARMGEGQHMLTLTGSRGVSDNLDWNTSTEGLLVSGSRGRACAWQIADMSKDDPRTVAPRHVIRVGDDDGEEEEDPDAGRMRSVNFSWTDPHAFVCGSTTGSVYYADVRAEEATEIFTLPSAATAVALSPLDGNSVLVGSGDGGVFFFDLRHSAKPVSVSQLHSDEVTVVQWCPHSRHLFASASKDANVCLYNLTGESLLFKHTGHTDVVMDLGWCWQEDCAGQLLSADCNAIMLWRPRDCFFYS